MLVIILGHSELQLGATDVGEIQALQLLLNIVSRAAVPLFLILAGEHLGPRLARDRAGAAWPYVRRLAALYAIGCAFYWVTDVLKLVRSRGFGPGGQAFIERLGANPASILMHGPRGHLWFLTVLMLIVVAAAVIVPRVQARWFLCGTAALYGIGLAIGPYSGPVGLAGNDWWFEFLLQAPLFFGLGLAFGLERPPRARTATAIALIAVGLVVHGFEVAWINQTYGTWPFRLGMLVGTVVYSAGVAMLALSPGANGFSRWISRFSPYVPAAFIIHVFFLETLRPPRGVYPEALVRVLLPVVTTILAFGTGWLVYRVLLLLRRRRRHAAAQAAA